MLTTVSMTLPDLKARKVGMAEMLLCSEISIVA